MAKNESNKKEKNSKDKKNFFKSFKAELKKVSWPTPKQLVNNTMAVVVIVLILSAIVFVLDFAFEAVNKYGIDKIKQSIVTSNEEQTVEEETNENVESTETTQTTDDESKDENQINQNTVETNKTTQSTEQTTTQTNETVENNQ